MAKITAIKQGSHIRTITSRMTRIATAVNNLDL